MNRFLFVGVILAVCVAEAREAVTDDVLARDWMRQDSDLIDVSGCFTNTAGHALESWMCARVVDELERMASPKAAVHRSALTQLEQANKAANDPAWRTAYLSAAADRRAGRLAKLTAKTKQIIFTRHCLIAAPGNISSNQHPSDRRSYKKWKDPKTSKRYLTWEPGAELCLLTLDDAGRATEETILTTEEGFIRDPALSYDGKTLAYARRENFYADDYQIYLMDVATRQTKRITAPISKEFPVSNIYPCFLPNGRIMFQSTRCGQLDPCGWDQTGTFFSMAMDGSDIVRLTADQVSTMSPAVLDDGRVLYTRWEYNDRTPVYVQPLFTMNPDGTAQAEYYGNNSWFPTSLLHARGVPGTGKAMAIAAGHHVLQKGKLVLLDPRRGVEEEAGVEYIASSAPDGTKGRKQASLIPVRHDKGQHLDGFGQEGPQYAHPFPLAEDNILVSFTADGYQGFGVWGAKSKNPNRLGEPFGLYWMDADGRREILAYDSKRCSLEATPLLARPLPFTRVSHVDDSKSFGTFYVKDVYHGPGSAGIPRGSIRKLRVIALEYRAAWVGSLWAGGPGGDSCAQTPIGQRNCSWDVKHVLGEADVAPDGSCSFTCPAHQAVYFQLIDDKGRLAQTMRSWTHLMGGESASCIGCHESKTETFQGTPAPTSERAPQRLKPVAGVAHPLLAAYEQAGILASVTNYLGVNAPRSMDPAAPIDGFSYLRRVQPIFDRHCVSCHAPGKAAAKIDLTSEPHRWRGTDASGASPHRVFCKSYMTLTKDGNPTALVNWPLQESAPTLHKPYTCGSGASRLLAYLEKAHCGAELTADEKESICLWLDLGIPFCGSYTEGRAWTPEEESAYDFYQRKRIVYAEAELKAARVRVQKTNNKKER
ncbi:MAG: hypothetical protein Q4G65_14920 [bacterium]|nr:hypothetical protein [bacterium]